MKKKKQKRAKRFKKDPPDRPRDLVDDLNVRVGYKLMKGHYLNYHDDEGPVNYDRDEQ